MEINKRPMSLNFYHAMQVHISICFLQWEPGIKNHISNDKIKGWKIQLFRRRRSATPTPRFCYSKIFACLSSHKQNHLCYIKFV